MKTVGTLALACGLAALISAPAQAQQGRGGRGFGGAGPLLTNKGVQKEINASEEQISKLTTLGEEISGKQREAFQGLQDLSMEERREKMQKIQATIQADVNKGLVEILKPEQVKRFHQIQTQQAGVRSFSTPRVVEALKLTDEQKEKVKGINQELMTSMTSLREEFQNDREGAMKKMGELNKAANEKALELLTSEQKTTWKELTGAPYEVKFEPRPNN
jgi:gas vesicle protein